MEQQDVTQAVIAALEETAVFSDFIAVMRSLPVLMNNVSRYGEEDYDAMHRIIRAQNAIVTKMVEVFSRDRDKWQTVLAMSEWQVIEDAERSLQARDSLRQEIQSVYEKYKD